MQELVHSASSLLITAEDFMVDVRAARADFGELFTWLHGCASTINCVEPELTASAKRKGLRSTRRFFDNDRLIALLRPSLVEEAQIKKGRDALSARMWQDGVNHSAVSAKLVAETLATEASRDIDMLLHGNVSEHFSKRRPRRTKSASGVPSSWSAAAPSAPLASTPPRTAGENASSSSSFVAASVREAALSSVSVGAPPASLGLQFEHLVKKIQGVMRQPSEMISASFVPKANIPVFRLTNGSIKSRRRGVRSSSSSSSSGADDVRSAVVPNCQMALFVKTLPATVGGRRGGGEGEGASSSSSSLDAMRKLRRRLGLPEMQQRFVAFAGQEAREVERGRQHNCVWIMQSPPLAPPEESRGGDGAAGGGGGGSAVQGRRKRGRQEEEEAEAAATTATAVKGSETTMWSVSCVPLPQGKHVVSLGFYGEDNGDENDELFLVLLLASSMGEDGLGGGGKGTELVLLGLQEEEDDDEEDGEDEDEDNAEKEPIPSVEIGIDLSLGLPSSATLVRLAASAGLVRSEGLFDRLVRKREVMSDAVAESLDVCADRQTVTVCTDENTLHLFRPDESDEDDEDDEDDDEEE